MLDQLLAGGGASLLNLVIHALLLSAVVRTVRDLSPYGSRDSPILLDSMVIVATGILLGAGHLLEVLVWAATYALVGARHHPAPTSFISPSAITPRSAMAM